MTTTQATNEVTYAEVIQCVLDGLDDGDEESWLEAWTMYRQMPALAPTIDKQLTEERLERLHYGQRKRG